MLASMYVFLILEINQEQKHNVVSILCSSITQNNGLNNPGTHTGQAFTNMLKSQLMANSSPRNYAFQKTDKK